MREERDAPHRSPGRSPARGDRRETAQCPQAAPPPAPPCRPLPPAGSPYLTEQTPAGSGRRCTAHPASARTGAARGAGSLSHAATGEPGAGAAGGSAVLAAGTGRWASSCSGTGRARDGAGGGARPSLLRAAPSDSRRPRQCGLSRPGTAGARLKASHLWPLRPGTGLSVAPQPPGKAAPGTVPAPRGSASRRWHQLRSAAAAAEAPYRHLRYWQRPGSAAARPAAHPGQPRPSGSRAGAAAAAPQRALRGPRADGQRRRGAERGRACSSRTRGARPLQCSCERSSAPAAPGPSGESGG